MLSCPDYPFAEQTKIFHYPPSFRQIRPSPSKGRGLPQCRHKLRQRGVLGVPPPRRYHFLLLALSGQRDKNQVFRRSILPRRVIRQNGYPFFRRHHHQDALTIGRAEQDIRPVACLLIQVHKKRVAVGIQRFRRGHVNDRLPPQLPAGQPHPLRQRMPGIQRRHQPHLLGQQPVHPFILLQVGAVPGQDQIKLIPQKSRCQLVGGAGEDTILARVGEGIVSSIGSSENHKSVLENPDSISKLVLRKGLDAGTAFEILSIDIADIDIGKNIGAALQIDQANADKNIAQAKAEERRAMAVASEQEMKAKAQEARAKVIEAEAEVPKAMAEAFRSGNLGIMDYYRMKNIEADTSMRENIAKPTTGNAGNQPLSK